MLYRRVEDSLSTQIQNPDEPVMINANEELNIIENIQMYKTSDGHLWDFIETIPAEGFELYCYVAPTLRDSMSEEVHWSVFMVSSHTFIPHLPIQASPDSGDSVENLAPANPVSLSASPGAS